jgi:hypothetical protein
MSIVWRKNAVTYTKNFYNFFVHMRMTFLGKMVLRYGHILSSSLVKRLKKEVQLG